MSPPITASITLTMTKTKFSSKAGEVPKRRDLVHRTFSLKVGSQSSNNYNFSRKFRYFCRPIRSVILPRTDEELPPVGITNRKRWKADEKRILRN